MTPERFFTSVLPALAKERALSFPALAARICVVVDTQAWTLALHDVDDATRVRKGGDPDAPFQLFLSASAFTRLLEGTLDVDDAIAKRHVGYRGDLRVLEQLGRMLAGSSSAVDVRSR